MVHRETGARVQLPKTPAVKLAMSSHSSAVHSASAVSPATVGNNAVNRLVRKRRCRLGGLDRDLAVQSRDEQFDDLAVRRGQF